MKEMSTYEVQQMSLEIMRDIHNFCIRNNIKYTLQGGTLIGAVRHKGFIPWDDDLDIAMPRPDYDRFIRTYKSEKGYKVFSRELPDGDDVLIAYARVCDMNNTFVDDSYYPWKLGEKGVWIDLFPLDGISDSYEIAEAECRRIAKIWHQGTILRWSNAPLCAFSSYFQKLKQICRKFLALFFSYRAVDKHIEECKKIKWGETLYYSNIAFMSYGVRERHRIAVMDEVILAPFGIDYFYIMKGYDEALRQKYGDYMMMPPKEKQVRGHDINKYYWKNR